MNAKCIVNPMNMVLEDDSSEMVAQKHENSGKNMNIKNNKNIKNRGLLPRMGGFSR